MAVIALPLKLLLVTVNRPFREGILSYASKLCERTGGSLTLLYIATHRKGQSRAEEAMASAGEQLMGCEVNRVVRVDRPVRALLKQMSLERYSLVVVGQRRKEGFLHRMLGSKGRQMLMHAPLPVLSVKNPRHKLERFLICTGGLETAERVVLTGAELAALVGAEATILYISGTVPGMYTGLMEMDESLDEILDIDTPLSRHLKRCAEILAQHQVQGGLEFQRGLVADGILREARDGEYDLIVMGETEAKQTLMGFLLGDMTERVLMDAPCGVLIVK